MYILKSVVTYRRASHLEVHNPFQKHDFRKNNWRFEQLRSSAFIWARFHFFLLLIQNLIYKGDRFNSSQHKTFCPTNHTKRFSMKNLYLVKFSTDCVYDSENVIGAVFWPLRPDFLKYWKLSTFSTCKNTNWKYYNHVYY